MHTMSLILDDLVHPQHLLQEPDFTLNIMWLNILQTSNKWYQTDIVTIQKTSNIQSELTRFRHGSFLLASFTKK